MILIAREGAPGFPHRGEYVTLDLDRVLHVSEQGVIVRGDRRQLSHRAPMFRDDNRLPRLFHQIHQFEAFCFELGRRYVHEYCLMTTKSGHHDSHWPALCQFRVEIADLLAHASESAQPGIDKQQTTPE